MRDGNEQTVQLNKNFFNERPNLDHPFKYIFVKTRYMLWAYCFDLKSLSISNRNLLKEWQWKSRAARVRWKICFQFCTNERSMRLYNLYCDKSIEKIKLCKMCKFLSTKRYGTVWSAEQILQTALPINQKAFACFSAKECGTKLMDTIIVFYSFYFRIKGHLNKISS